MNKQLFHLGSTMALIALNPSPGNSETLKIREATRYDNQTGAISISQFSDIQPTDWTYQALSNLLERYGCVAGYPNATFEGKKAISRFEAAALLNACLERVTETSDQLKKLTKEFEKELAILKGRVDGLATRVGELEANQFSTTTKLSGQATYVIGANTFSGNAINTQANTFNLRDGSTINLPNATTFNYDLQLSLDTSFSGKDLLRTILRAGDFGSSAFGGFPEALSLSTLETAFQEEAGANILGIDKLYYQLPLGHGFTATVGPRVGQEDMLALWPSAYPADTILNALTLNGAPAAYNKNLGAGAGIWWQYEGYGVSANYVASRGNIGALGDPSDTTGGLGSKSSGASASIQLGYVTNQWGLAAIWSQIQPLTTIPGGTPMIQTATNDPSSQASTNAFGLSGFWQPLSTGWIPSISLGWGINSTTYQTEQAGASVSTSQSWMAGLQWKDVLAKGNDFGMAVGQPVFATALTGSTIPDDGNFIWEWWYKLQISDQITVTPALIYLSRPLGQSTPSGQTFSQLGGLVKTTFRF